MAILGKSVNRYSQIAIGSQDKVLSRLGKSDYELLRAGSDSLAKETQRHAIQHTTRVDSAIYTNSVIQNLRTDLATPSVKQVVAIAAQVGCGMI